MKRSLIAGLSLLSAVGAVPLIAHAADLCIGTGSTVNCGLPSLPPTYTPPADPFAGVSSFNGSLPQSARVSAGGASFDEVTGIAYAVTTSAPIPGVANSLSYVSFMVMSDRVQGIVVIPYGTDGGPDTADMQTLSTGAASGPTGVVTADLDGDGQQDIVAVNGDDDSLSLFFGHSDGSFSAPVRVPLASTPGQFVLADMDGDGRPDLLLPDTTAGILDLYANDGHSGFAAPLPLNAGTHPLSIAAGDLDGDGDIDVAVGDDDDSVSVLLNDGHGGFSLTSYPARVHPDQIALLEMGILSSTRSILLYAYDTTAGTTAMLADNGDGTFQPAKIVVDQCDGTDPCLTASGGQPASSGGGTKSKPGKPAAAAPASGGGGDLGLLSLTLLGLAGFIRRRDR